MTGNSSEELTTEQILSSIREILVDGDKKSQNKKEELKSSADDILELTQSMAIKEVETASKIASLGNTKLNVNSEEVARNIIRSFARNFTSLDKDSQRTYLSQTSNNEDSLLRASISKSVEDWVLKNMTSDFELQKNIKEEVAKQVNVWFDANLVKLVNSTIRQELERVMVKVDSAQ